MAGELGGVWAQPVKALDGYVFVVETEDERWPLLDADRFTQSFVDVQFHYRNGALSATRRDFVPQDRPALFTTLTLRNDGDEPVDARVIFYAWFDLKDAWRTALGGVRNPGETVLPEHGRLVARALSAPDAWAVAVGGEDAPENMRVTNGPDGHHVGQMEYAVHLEPGAEQSWSFCVVVETDSGPEAALRHLDEWSPQREMLLAEKRALYEALLAAGLRFHSPDARFDAAFDLARANAQVLEAESQALGRYFYAGLETFPYWFSDDLAYGAGGLTPAGFARPWPPTCASRRLKPGYSAARCRTSSPRPARSSPRETSRRRPSSLAPSGITIVGPATAPFWRKCIPQWLRGYSSTIWAAPTGTVMAIRRAQP